MNALNHALSVLFDALLAPLEALGTATALIAVSGVFGVLALVAFKHMSWQGAIRATKDRIKGHMIAIRIYQDDLRVVGGSVAKVLGRNAQYLALNFGPFVPLAIPFAFVAAQFVVRYAYDPIEVTAADARLLPGQGTMVSVELAPERRRDVERLAIILPEGLEALSPLVRAPADGRAFQEVVARAPGEHEIAFELRSPEGELLARETKLLVAGADAPRAMQPRRVSGRDWYGVLEPDRWPVLWPAEPAFASDSPFRSIALAYPHRDLGWLPDGEVGILATFVLASMVFGFLALKPLGVQI